MAEYDNTNSGALFVAKEKRTPKSPDYTGSINVNGQEFFVSGWKKTSRNNQTYLSLALTPKNQQNNQGGNRQQSQGGASGWPAPNQGTRGPSSEPPMDFDDDIPF